MLPARNSNRPGAPMQIVDAQIHIWSQGLPSNDAHWQVTSVSAEKILPMMDEAGVAGAVIHPPGWDPDSHAIAAKAVEDYPGRFAVLGTMPLEGPNGPEKLKTWKDSPGMLGLRYTMLEGQERDLFDAGALDWLWAGAEEYDIPISLLCTDILAELGAVAERHPGLRLTIDHLGGRGGTTKLKDHAAMVHMPELLKLARLPNVAVKATGAPGYSAEAYPFPIMLDYVRQVFDAFGPDRTFWGTDITKMPCSWTQCVDMFQEGLPWLKGDDLRLVMGDAICAWWGWKR